MMSIKDRGTVVDSILTITNYLQISVFGFGFTYNETGVSGH